MGRLCVRECLSVCMWVSVCLLEDINSVYLLIKTRSPDRDDSSINLTISRSGPSEVTRWTWAVWAVRRFNTYCFCRGTGRWCMMTRLYRPVGGSPSSFSFNNPYCCCRRTSRWCMITGLYRLARRRPSSFLLSRRLWFRFSTVNLLFNWKAYEINSQSRLHSSRTRPLVARIFQHALLPGVYLRGVYLPQGVYLPRGYLLRYSPVTHVTHATENITLPQLRFGR